MGWLFCYLCQATTWNAEPTTKSKQAPRHATTHGMLSSRTIASDYPRAHRVLLSMPCAAYVSLDVCRHCKWGFAMTTLFHGTHSSRTRPYGSLLDTSTSTICTIYCAIGVCRI